MTPKKKFWPRITDGLALSELWKNFRTDARSSYRLYSLEVDSIRQPGVGRVKHFFRVFKQFLWAIIEKLSPARRVFLVIALILLFANMGGDWHDSEGDLVSFHFGGAFWGGILLFMLLALEIADRVVMKRDLQIAKEIRSWLLPANPPPVPDLESPSPLVPLIP